MDEWRLWGPDAYYTQDRSESHHRWSNSLLVPAVVWKAESLKVTAAEPARLSRKDELWKVELMHMKID